MKVRMLKSLTFSAHLTPFQYFVFDHSFPYTMSEAQYDRRDALTRQEMERKSEGITGAGDSRISEPPSSFSQLSSEGQAQLWPETNRVHDDRAHGTST